MRAWKRIAGIWVPQPRNAAEAKRFAEIDAVVAKVKCK